MRKIKLYSFFHLIALIGVFGLFQGCNKDDRILVDGDGNTYNIIDIGSQKWLKENLRTTKYNDGKPITLITNDGQWIHASTDGFCWYNNDEAANKQTYGALYNWYAVNTGKLCPKGWHVPSENEWIAMETFLGMNSAEAKELGWRGVDKGIGGMLKSTTGEWSPPNQGANNSSGFTGLPGGTRTMNGNFDFINNYGYWWCAVQADEDLGNMRSVSWELTTVFKGLYPKTYGMSVRCVKD